MKKPNKFFRKAACFCLVICMVLAMFPAAFADGAAPTELTPEQQALEAERIRKKKLLEEELARQAAEAAAAQAAAEAQAAQQAAAEANAQASQTALDAQASTVNQEPTVTEAVAVNDAFTDTQSTIVGEEFEANAANLADEESAEKPVEGESAGENTAADTADASAVEEAEETVEQSGDEEAEDESTAEDTADASAVEEAVEQSGDEEAADENAVTEESSEEGASEEPAAESSDNTESAEEVPAQTTEVATLFGLTAPAPAASNALEGSSDSTLAGSDNTSSVSAPVVLGSPTTATGIWKAAGKFFSTVKEAIESIFSDPEAIDATVELTENYEGDEGIDIEVDTGKNVVIDLCKKTFKVISGIAAKITGNGSVTIKNGTIESGDGDTAVQTDVDELTINNTTLVGGSDTASGALDINGGDVDIAGKTTIDSGKAANTAIDISGDSEIDVNTTGIVLGKVNAGSGTETELHNGYYNGEITAESGAEVEVDGGNYTNNVSKYVSGKTNYAEIRTPNGAVYSAGKNIPESAFVSSRFAPTAVNILKSSGAVNLPAGVAAINSTGKVIFINGRPVFCGQIVFIPGCGCYCSSASIVDGANSVWYKSSEDGLTIELSSAISYVTIDNVKVNAVIDGVYAELSADTLEALSAGSHTVRFVLKNGSVAATTVKVAPDEKVEWADGSENGLEYEMSGNVKKVLIDHVKVAAEISGKNVSIPASILQDLKTGNHTVEFVLENTSHVVTSITVK